MHHPTFEWVPSRCHGEEHQEYLAHRSQEQARVAEMFVRELLRHDACSIDAAYKRIPWNGWRDGRESGAYHVPRILHQRGIIEPTGAVLMLPHPYTGRARWVRQWCLADREAARNLLAKILFEELSSIDGALLSTT